MGHQFAEESFTECKATYPKMRCHRHRQSIKGVKKVVRISLCLSVEFVIEEMLLRDVSIRTSLAR